MQLCKVVKQRDLPVGLEETLLRELATHGHLRELLRLLETAIRFLASGCQAIAGVADNAQMPVGVLLTEVVGTDADMWLTCSTPTLRSAFVNVTFLARLYAVIQRGLGIEAFSRVDVKYKTPLDESAKELVKACLVSQGGVDWRALVPLLAAVLNDNLSDNVSIRADASLKQDLLVFIDGFEEVDGFMAHFPEELRVEHCLSLYQFLSAIYGGGSAFS